MKNSGGQSKKNWGSKNKRILSIVYTRGQKSAGLAQIYIAYVKLHVGNLMMWTCWKNLGFSLYTILSVYHMVTILENWMNSEVRVSTDVDMLLLNTKDQVQ